MQKEQIMSFLINLLSENNEKNTDQKQDGEIRIVVLQRGWIFVGSYYENGNDCRLDNSYCIRRWGTTKGLGELAIKGKLSDTILDKSGTVLFNKLTTVTSILCNQEIWKKIL